MTPPKPMTAWQAETLPDALPLHFRRNVAEGPGGCWLWTRSTSPDGYGWASLGNRTHQAHRLAYRLVLGEPVEGLVIDHLCRVRHCVNPAHMELVSPGENLRRSPITPAGMVRCAKSHELVPYYNQRRCLTCLADYKERVREQRRLAERDRRARKAGRS